MAKLAALTSFNQFSETKKAKIRESILSNLPKTTSREAI